MSNGFKLFKIIIICFSLYALVFIDPYRPHLGEGKHVNKICSLVVRL